MPFPPQPLPILAAVGLGSLFAQIACTGAPDRSDAGAGGTIYAMGGVPVEIRIFRAGAESDTAGHLDAVAAEIERLEDLLSTWRPASPVSRLNRDAGGDWFAPGPDVMQVLAMGRWIYGETGGTFDPTIGPLVRLWRQAADRGTVPTGEEIEAARALLGGDEIQIGPYGETVRLGRPGMEVDLGGLAKGYIVDRAARLLESRGVERGMVSAGGDLQVIVARGLAPLRIGIRDPDGGPDRILGSLPLWRGAAATSGNYERYIEIDGRRYGHILDPRDGRPATGTVSATVLSPTAMRADGLATGLFVLGAERGIELVESLDGVEAVILTREGDRLRRWVSSGLTRIDWEEPVAGWAP